MARIARRNFLKLSGAGALAATGGGLATILASGRAPAYAQGTTLTWLRWIDFVPASDQLLREKIIPECAKALGIKLKIEMINANDMPGRIGEAVEMGSGPDVICALSNWPQLFPGSLVDVTDVAEEIGKTQAGYYPVAKAVATHRGRWIGVPWAIVGALVAYRKSWFHEIGVDTFPDSWEGLREAGKKLKAKKRPIGQTLGHTFGDAPGFWYPYLWSWGGKEVEADGKSVAIKSKETLESVKFAVGFWKDACEPAAIAWDDTANNRAFLAGGICATNNGASIYIEAKRKPPLYLTNKGTPLYEDIAHAPLPKGAGGQFNLPGPFTNMVMRYSPNQQAAKQFLHWVSSPTVFSAWFASQQGYTEGATKVWADNPLWKKDPVLMPFRALPAKGRLPGYAGGPARASAEALTQYVIVEMYAQAIQGIPAEAAVAWAEKALKKIYA